MPRHTFVCAPPHVVQLFEAGSAAQHVDGAGGVDHRGVPNSGSPCRSGAHPHPRCACSTLKRRSHARRPKCTLHLCKCAKLCGASALRHGSVCVCLCFARACCCAHRHTPIRTRTLPTVRTHTCTTCACANGCVCVCACERARAGARVRMSPSVRARAHARMNKRVPPTNAPLMLIVAVRVILAVPPTDRRYPHTQ
jgi:hypothetical protein